MAWSRPGSKKKHVPFQIPDGMLPELEEIADEECRTLMELFREALRDYIKDFWHRQGGLPK